MTQVLVETMVERFNGSAADWDAFVRSADGWTPFHLMAWRTVMTRVFGHDTVYLAARRDGALVGVLPLVRVKGLFGHFLVSMPFVNYGGPLGDAAAVSALATEAERIARADGAKLLELRSRGPLSIGLPVSTRKITVVLDLPDGGGPALWKKLDAKVRSQVRRPQKDGVTVRFGADQVAPFFSVFAHHMRDLGTPTQPKRLFETIAECFGDDVWFGCAYLGDQAIAGGCGFRWNGEFEMTWASALNAHKKLSPNMLLYWAFMERAAEEGLHLFNFGRCSPGVGTHKFKRQWGSRDEQLHWYDWSPTAGTTTPSPDQGAYSWGPRMWKRLPVPLATALGPLIVRAIP
jgi:FemAB-related protein (PEP-CTERM system-associated)